MEPRFPGRMRFFIPSAEAPSAPPRVCWPPQGGGTGLRAESGHVLLCPLNPPRAGDRRRREGGPSATVKCSFKNLVKSMRPTLYCNGFNVLYNGRIALSLRA